MSPAAVFAENSGPYRLEFWYHMLGDGVGSLMVTASDGERERRVFEQDGPGESLQDQEPVSGKILSLETDLSSLITVATIVSLVDFLRNSPITFQYITPAVCSRGFCVLIGAQKPCSSMYTSYS